MGSSRCYPIRMECKASLNKPESTKALRESGAFSQKSGLLQTLGNQPFAPICYQFTNVRISAQSYPAPASKGKGNASDGNRKSFCQRRLRSLSNCWIPSKLIRTLTGSGRRMASPSRPYAKRAFTSSGIGSLRIPFCDRASFMVQTRFSLHSATKTSLLYSLCST